MRLSAEERAKEHLGEKRGHVTIGEFVRKHPSTGTAMVKASCECGNEFETTLSALLDDDRKYCDQRSCPIAAKDRQDARDLAGSNAEPAEADSQVSKRRPGNKRRAGNKTQGASAKPRRASKGRRRSAVDTADRHISALLAETAERNKSLEPAAAKVVTAVNGGGPALAHRDFASISAVVESLAVIAEQVTIEDAVALVEEIKRLNGHFNSDGLALLRPRGLANFQTVLPSYLKVAEAFLAFRFGIE